MTDLEIRETSAVPAVAQVAAAVLLGLVALPLLLGSQPVGGRIEDVIWLASGLLIGIWLLVIAPSLARDLATLFTRYGPTGGAASRRSAPAAAGVTGVAQWLVALGYVLLVQAILRRPVVLALSVTFDSVTVEAIFAASVLVLLIVALLRLHWAARPLVEMATWSVLDALIATSGSEQSTSASTVGSATVAATTRPDTAGATRPAARTTGTLAARLQAASGDATQAATRSEATSATVSADRARFTEAPTVFARASENDATVAEAAPPSPKETPSDATLLADDDEHVRGAAASASLTETTSSRPREDQTSVVVPADGTVVEPQNDETIDRSGSGDSSAPASPNDATVIASADETTPDAQHPRGRFDERR